MAMPACKWRFQFETRECFSAQVLAGIFQTVADSQMAAFERRCAQMVRMSGPWRGRLLYLGMR